jgi:repressor LexA
MSKQLTDRQSTILSFIRQFAIEKGYPPTIPEIQQEFGIRSPNGVNNHIKALIRKGCLRRDSSRARALDIVGRFEGIPIIGRIAAGQPILAEEHFEGVFDLREFQRSGEVFMLRVSGDSMVNARIFDGDMVIVRMQETVEPGEIGVAIINNEATVKRIYCDGNIIRLVPENETMKPITVTRTDPDFRIGGKVVGVMRYL